MTPPFDGRCAEADRCSDYIGNPGKEIRYNFLGQFWNLDLNYLSVPTNMSVPRKPLVDVFTTVGALE